MDNEEVMVEGAEMPEVEATEAMPEEAETPAAE